MALAAHLRFEHHLVPTNREPERRRVLDALAAGVPVDPAFTFAPLDPAAGDRVRALQDEVDPAASPWHAILADDLAVTARLADAVAGRDPGGITAATVARYGVPTDELVAAAEEVLATTPPGDGGGPTVDAATAAALLQAAADAVGLDGWRVVASDGMSARMDVIGRDRTIRVRRGSRYTDHELRRLAVHEVGTHAARAANGSRQPVALLGVLSDADLATEEGLAVWHEQRHGLSDPDVMRTYALRVLAASWALEQPFSAVLAGLAAHTDPEAAFDVVARAKRGLPDPSVPGAHVKDQVYLGGLRAVGAHLRAHPDDHDLLLAGCVGLPRLDLVRALADDGTLVPPQVRPDAVARAVLG